MCDQTSRLTTLMRTGLNQIEQIPGPGIGHFNRSLNMLPPYGHRGIWVRSANLGSKIDFSVRLSNLACEPRF